jgi:DNA-binding NtrC family response regulator
MSQQVKILLVDYERNILELVQEGLGDTCRIIPAGNDREALAQLKNEAVDVIILNLRLPGINGMYLLHIIQGIDNSVPVIAFSSDETLRTVARAFRSGVYAYYDKPFNTGEFIASVRCAAQAPRVTHQPETNSIVSVDMEQFIAEFVENSIQKGNDLNSALQYFREQAIDLVSQKISEARRLSNTRAA